MQVMNEIGIEVSQQMTKPLTAFAGQQFDLIITMCEKAPEKSPVFSRPVQTLHWSFDDPARNPEGSEARLGEFRRVRDRVYARVLVFLGEITLGLERGSAPR